MQRWRAGDQILLREIFRERIWTARPLTVAHSSDELTALYLAPGTVFKVPAFTHRNEVLRRLRGGWSLADHEWTRGRGERVVNRLEARQSPFRDGWERWQPDPAWPIPQLPPGWNDL